MTSPIQGPRDLPQVAASVDPAIRDPLNRVIEEVQRLLAFRGDELDAAITFRKAAERGLIDKIGNALTGSVTYVVNHPTTVIDGNGNPSVDPTPDYTPPPSVTGLVVSAGFSQVIVIFNAPNYTQGHGHKQTNIYAIKKDPSDAELPTFSNMTPRVFSAPGALTVISLPSELNTRWHVWAKFETNDGVESTVAAGGVNGYALSPGVFPTTGQDISQLLELLGSNITESLLDSVLRAKIELITADESVVGSVSRRVKAEADARQAQISAEILSRIGADAATLESAQTYTNNFTYSQATIDGNIAASGTVLAANFASGDAATLAAASANTQTWAYSKAQSDGAISALSSTLTASFGAGDATTLAQANSFTYSRAAIDGSIASTTTSLQAYANNAASASAVSAQNYTNSYAYAKTNGEALAGTMTVLSGTVGDLTGAVAHLDEVVTTNDATTSQSITQLYSAIGGAGANRVRNSGFEQASPSDAARALGWAEYNNSPATEPSVLSLVTGRLGGSAQRITWTGSNISSKGVVCAENLDGDKLGGVAGGWKVGTSYVISWYARSNTGTAAALGMRSAWDVAPASLTTLLNPTLDAIEWRRYAEKLTWGGTAEDSGRLYLTVAYGQGQTGYIEIDDVQVQEGELLTGYADGNQAVLSAALQQEASTRAALDGAVQALWTVRAEVSSGGRTMVGGFGLAATATAAGGSRIDFGVRADQFYIGAPSGQGVADSFPFVVRTTESVENGVTIPKGVYMNSAYIVNLSALYARFGTLIADSIAVGQINAAHMTLGDGTVGGNLKSTEFVAGSGSTPGQGWLWTPSGNAYLNNAVVYGTIYASAGVFAGSLSAASGTFAGTLNAANGSFSGTLAGSNITGVTGTFSGSLNVNSGGPNRMEITDSRIKIFSGGVERVRIGDLS